MTNSATTSFVSENIFESEDDYDITIPTTSNDLTISSSTLTPSPKQSPTAPRRGYTDTQRRRASLAARRQSNVQVKYLFFK